MKRIPPKGSKERGGYTTRLVNRALRVMGEIEELKALYGELDDLTIKLRKQGFISKEIGLDENGNMVTLELFDNFANTNTVFNATAVKRFQLRKQTIKEKRNGKKV